MFETNLRVNEEIGTFSESVEYHPFFSTLNGFAQAARQIVFLGQCCTKLKSGLLKSATAFQNDS